MTSSGISQKEYLKKYLSSGDKKKKKKPKTNTNVNRLRIVDDDIDLRNMRSLNEDELDLYELQEDAPQIAGIIDERPEEIKIKEKFGTKKWKVISDDNDFGVKIIDKLSPRDVKEDNIDLSPTRENSRKLSKYEENGSENVPSKTNRQRHNSDISPPRQSKHDDVLPPRKLRESDSDTSPPRKSRKDNSDESPLRRDYNAKSRSITHQKDASPLRTNRKNDWDNRNKNRNKENSDSDASPPRKNKRGSSENPHQRRANNYETDDAEAHPKKISKSDLQNRRQKYDSDESPPRRSKKNSSEKSQPHKYSCKYDSDASPPRRAKKLYSESPIIKNQTSERSYKKESYSLLDKRTLSSSSHNRGSRDGRSERRKSDSDESPPRRRRRTQESVSPPNREKKQEWEYLSKRHGKKRMSRSPEMKSRKGRDSDDIRRSRWGETYDKKQSSQKDLSKHKQQIIGSSCHDKYDRRRVERSNSTQRQFDQDQSLGKQPREKYIDQGKKKTLDGRKAGLVGAGELKAEIEDLKKKEKDMFEKMDVSISGRGAAPVMRDRKTGKRRNLEEEARQQQEKDEKQAERDAKYMEWGRGLKQVSDKAQKMEEDLHEMSKPLARYADDVDLDKYLKDQEREGDPMLDYIKSKKTSKEEKGKPRYEGSFMPNRFGICPGYRWDGVDRSNGYEKQWFETQNAKKAVQEEAYKWSTSDM